MKPVLLKVALVKTKIKKRAEETLEPPTVVVNECLTDMSQASLAAVPNMSALRKIIRRKRNLSFCPMHVKITW